MKLKSYNQGGKIMKISRFYLLIACFISTLSVGCDNITDLINPKRKDMGAGSGLAVAKVANKAITLEALNREIDTFNATVGASIDANRELTAEQKKDQKDKNLIDSRDKKIEYLKEIVVRRVVFAQAAMDRGLDRREDIRDVLELTRNNILGQQMQNEITKNIEISQAELEAAYNSVKDQLKQPEQRKVREIALKTEGEAKQVLVELLQGADFNVLARDRSVAESSKQSGELDYVTKGTVGGIFDDVVFSPGLQQGSISSVFKGPKGYYIVKIEGIKEGKQLSLSEVQDELKNRLLGLKWQEEMDKFYNKVTKDNIKVEIKANLVN